MTDRLAKVLDALEHATQQTDEPSYGREVPDGYCWRCVRQPALDGPAGVCATCRAVLLGDEPVTAGVYHVVVVIDPEQLRAGVARMAELCSTLADHMGVAVREAAEEVQRIAAALELPARPSEPLRMPSPVERARRAHRPCPRHGDTSMHGGLCRACARDQARGRMNQHGRR